MNRKGKKGRKIFIKREKKRFYPLFQPSQLLFVVGIVFLQLPVLLFQLPGLKKRNRIIKILKMSRILSIVLGFFLPSSTALPEFAQMDLEPSPECTRLGFIVGFNLNSLGKSLLNLVKSNSKQVGIWENKILLYIC